MDISILVGLTLSEVVQNGVDSITFKTTCGRTFSMFHSQNCCESVTIEDVCGDLQRLVGSPIVEAYESTNQDNPKGDGASSFTWTFYTIRNNLETVTIRWYGESNGYYSESVDFVEEK